MLNKLQDLRAKKSSEQGFTIIEVMIVLAIAALIMLIIFLAVPALQRNSRNTNRKSDVGQIGAAANNLVSNNNGKVDAATVSDAKLQAELNNLGYYTKTNVTTGDSGTAANLAKQTDKDKVRVVTNAKCGATADVDAVAQTRQIAILYATENGSGGATAVCVDL